MKLRSIELFQVAVPLRKAIQHASHTRVTSENLVVRATLADGTTGHGEGVPRDYVTGETVETATAMLASYDAPRHLGSPGDWTTFVRRLDTLLDLRDFAGRGDDPRGIMGNAARCALELALLDAYGRHFGQSVADAFRAAGDTDGILLPSPGPVRYSAAITAESPRKERVSAWKFRIYGFHQVKVKVGVPGQDDPKRLEALRSVLGGSMDIRLDANEAWSPEELVDRVAPLLRFGPTALEQPVPHERVEALRALRPTLGVPIMLDESMCGLTDALRIVMQRLADILNLRISKCGGLLPTYRLMGLAKRAGLAVQLGCHPGETGLLSAAGRHLACSVGPLVRYLEGSYDRHVLGRNLIREDITFRYGGRARPITGPGLGVSVDEDALAAMTTRRREVVYD
jgi:muconate cycloisomerase